MIRGCGFRASHGKGRHLPPDPERTIVLCYPAGWTMLALFALLPLLLQRAGSQQCFMAPPCFTYTYENCSSSEIGSEQDAVHVVLESGGLGEVEDVFYQSILTVLCEQLQPPAVNSTVGMAPYCWSTVGLGYEPCNDDDQCNCTTVDVVVYDTQSERALPAQQVARILAETQTQFALRFAGVFIADATAVNGRTALFDVPLASWVFVGVGLVASTVVFTAPAWWKTLKRIGASSKCCHRQ